MTNLDDAGGWFRIATGVTTPIWEPGDGGFGHISLDTDLTVALNLFRSRPIVVFTGAGVSTGSGLPDYRSHDAVPRFPVTFQELTGSDLSRCRYWVRLMVGWNWLEAARPGLAHLALAGLGRHTPLTGVVMQNVDGLHQAAGSEPVVDLYGNLACVVYLGCGQLSGRAELQVRLLRLDPEVAARLSGLSERVRTASDGDAEAEGMTGSIYPACPVRGGMLKPDVVYFGKNARHGVVGTANALFDVAEVLLVLGSTPTVTSGLWFACQAVRQDKDVITADDGVIRVDDLAALCIRGRLEHILSLWVDTFRAGRTGPPFTAQGVCLPWGSPAQSAT